MPIPLATSERVAIPFLFLFLLLLAVSNSITRVGCMLSVADHKDPNDFGRATPGTPCFYFAVTLSEWP